MKNLICLTLIAFCMFSCQDELTQDRVTSMTMNDLNELPYEESRNISLAELADVIATVDPTEAAKMTLDRVEDLNDKVDANEKKEVKPIYVNFRRPSSCKSKFSICIMTDQLFDNDEDLSRAILTIQGDYMRIAPIDGTNGYTKEGVFPVDVNLDVPQSLAKSAGRSNLELVPGLYQAAPDGSVVVRIASKNKPALTFEEARALSLEDLKNFVSAEEAHLIDTWEVQDYSSLYTEAEEKKFVITIKVKFKDQNKCTSDRGLCLIIDAGAKDQDLTPSTLKTVNGKLAITPMSGKHGFTADGVLPMFEEVTVAPEVAKLLGYKTLTIKPGLYQAKYDRSAQDFRTVLVDYTAR